MSMLVKIKFILKKNSLVLFPLRKSDIEAKEIC